MGWWYFNAQTPNRYHALLDRAGTTHSECGSRDAVSHAVGVNTNRHKIKTQNDGKRDEKNSYLDLTKPQMYNF